MNTKFTKKQKSFTLIELLVVIVIIGVLAAVIVVTTTSSIGKANIAKLKVFEESVANNLAANMVSRWKLDEINGTLTPDAWGNNPGTLTNSPISKAENDCVSGNCLSFNSSNSSYVSCGDLSNSIGENDVTYSIWVKPSANGVDGSTIYSFTAFMGKGAGGYSGDLHVGHRSDNKVRVYYENLATSSYIDSINPINLDTWSFIVVSTNSSKVSLYIDGTFSKSGNIATNFVINNMQIGYCPYAAYYNGLIDDVRVYHSTLSSSQIKQNYIAGLNSLLSRGSISKEEYNSKILNLSQAND